MSLLEALSIGISGFALAGSLFALLYGFVRKRWELMGLFASWAFLLALFAILNVVRRSSADLALVAQVNRWCDMIGLLGFAILPYLFLSLSSQRYTKVAHGLAAFFFVLICAAIFLPNGITWHILQSNHSVDFGIWGSARIQQGVLSPLNFICRGSMIVSMLYCMWIAWQGPTLGVSYVILKYAVPIGMIMTTIHVLGIQLAWWQWPNIGEVYGAGIFLTMASTVWVSEKDLVSVRRLEESERKYRSLFELSRDALVTLSPPNWSFTSCNQAALEMFGLKEISEFTCLAPVELSPKEQSDGENSEVKASRMLEIAMQTGVHFFEWIHMRKDGSIFPCTVLLTKVHVGESTFLYATIRDITEQKKTESTLRENEQFLRMIFDTLSEGVALNEIVYDEQGEMIDYRVLKVNPAFYTVAHLNNQPVIGQLATDLYKMPRSMIKEFWDSHKQKTTVAYTEMRSPLNDCHFFVATSPFIDNKFITSFFDITERIRNEEGRLKLEQHIYKTQKLESLGILAGGIAHDFNNILAAIIGYTEMTREHLINNQPLLHNIQQILASANRAKDLVGQILSFSRQRPDEMRPMYIYPIAEEVIQLLRASLPASIEIHHQLKKDSTPILGNSTRIHEVVMNLCVNASHAMNEKGVLEIGLEEIQLTSEVQGTLGTGKAGHYSMLEIKDNGCGISAKVLPHIFEPYYTTKPFGEGTGLGLAVVAGIVQSHGGFIMINSTPETGTIFQVYFPRHQSSVKIVDNAQVTIKAGSEHILYVDDEDILCDVISKILVSLGYRVMAFTDSSKALEEFKRHPHAFDLVITDQSMPNLTGMDLSKELLQLNKDIPIILCTGYSNHIDEIAALNAGLAGYCLKPFGKEEIATKIRSVLDAKRSCATRL